MASKEELRQRQDRLLSVYEEVERELSNFPSVEGVGIGLKEVAGQITDEICFRVYVDEKKERNELSPEQVIPEKIAGFRTDIIKVYKYKVQSFVERRDTSEHAVLTGGIVIGAETASPSDRGTLGWFGTQESDRSPVLLTCQHVLYPIMTIGDKFPKNGDKVGQPIFEHRCCSDCNVIGTSIIGIGNDGVNDKVDCAIAKLNDTRRIDPIVSNKATDRKLKVKGKARAIVGTNVQKIGARSGFTKGIVVDIGAVTIPDEEVPLPDTPSVKKRRDQIIIRPADDETYENEEGKKAFSNQGDSGSVVLDEDNHIIGLIYANVKERKGFTLANHIDNVLAALEEKGHKITLAISPDGENASGGFFGHDTKNVGYMSTETPLLERMAQTKLGKKLVPLIKKHKPEVMNLVNHHRPVTVVWHRYQGPAFFAHLLNSARQPEYLIPPEVEGISHQVLLLKMLTVLKEHGSELLRRDIEVHALDLINITSNSSSVTEILTKFDSVVTI